MATVTPQPTPNPRAFKFTVTGHSFSAPQTIGSAEAAAGTPFEGLFALEGVAGVFATADFVTVTKTPDADWANLVEPVKHELEQRF